MKKILQVVLLLLPVLSYHHLAAQSCTGSLGAPVVKIDFGSGATNPGPTLAAAIPGASTSYNFASYATGQPPSPPLDGDYALVNQVPQNGAWFSGATDHTGNAGGYMAFFNSSPTPGEFYRQTISNLCPGTTYEFAAWIANVINVNILPGGILPNITFKILDPATQNALASFNTGDIPNAATMTWTQYSFLFVMPVTNTSVTLVLENNNVGGTSQPGNDLAIDDITFRACGPLTTASFSFSVAEDSIAITSCSSADIFGQVNGGLTNPAFQWQISDDGGFSFTDLPAAATQDATVSGLAEGAYLLRLLSAESGNISSANCRFISNTLILTVTGCSSAGPPMMINDYAAALQISSCSNKILLDDAAAFNPGDTVVIMQMKGASIDSANSSSFGTIMNYNNAGQYEFNYVKNKNGNTIELLNSMLYPYDAVHGKVQLIRVPYYQTITLTDTLTCLPWDGTKGGVVIVNSATNVILNAPIDVSYKGFRGGQIGGGFSCNNLTDWAVPVGDGGNKGESITEYVTGQEAGGARLANGGGGAYAANTGAGGGANYGQGGTGGEQYNGCATPTQSIGGEALDYSILTRVFMGGAGGGSQQDDGQPVSVGGNGGGIVIIKAATFNGNDQQIMANGESISTLVRDEGGAGGGAGGSVLMYVNNYSGAVTIDINGGDGSSNYNQIYPTRCHGPGGGGGGGYIGFKSGPIPPGISVNVNGGKAGFILNPSSPCFNSTRGALDGESGGGNFFITLPEARTPFVGGIDSVVIKDSATGCKSYDFKGLAYTQGGVIQNWYWDFGDNSNATTQNATHTYSVGGNYIVTLIVTDVGGCQDSVKQQLQPGGINFDFLLSQDVCDPGQVQFTAAGDSTADVFWSFGDGAQNLIDRNPPHTYANPGLYTVQYSTGNGICADTVTKSIFIGYQPGNIILTPDTGICYGSAKQLRGNVDTTMDFCWSPSNFLNDVHLVSPVSSPTATITYTLLGITTGANLVTNGDFNAGNSGFSSGYTSYGLGTIAPGQYTVRPGSTFAGPSAVDCKDHTSATGNMLLINSDAGHKNIWKQPVNITPNTNYIFSCWIQSVNASAAGILAMSINGIVVKDSLLTPTGTCIWQKHVVTWNSGNQTSALLSIEDRTIPKIISGSDNFAIDDISFTTYTINKDSVRITVDTAFVDAGPDTSVCASVPVQLTGAGAVQYAWSPAAGLSSTGIANPVATPASSTTYFVTGTSLNGCVATDSVSITIKAAPVTGKSRDTTICSSAAVQLFATGGVGYLWSPAATLSNPSIANPVATPVSSTTYVVLVTGANNCTKRDSVQVTVKTAPVFTVSPDQSICLNSSTQLSASGGNSYLWSPAAAVSNPVISNPVTVTSSNTSYSVIIKDTACGYADTLHTNLTVLPLPVITANKSNDVNCTVGSTTLMATGALQYNWTPATGLSDANAATTAASPVTTTTYTVTGTNGNGCSSSDTVTVIVEYNGRVSYSMPNAFTPNGDGNNDCFRIKYAGQLLRLHFSIYNRYGSKVFETSNPADCWDGTYKGLAAPPGNYVYHIQAVTGCGAVERKGNVLLIR